LIDAENSAARLPYLDLLDLPGHESDKLANVLPGFKTMTGREVKQ
jgi:hypothetical protein